MASQPGKQTNTIHILLNMSQSKCNQTMRFSQLIEYKKRNIFLNKSYTEWGGVAEKLFPDPFLRRQN